MTDRTTNSATFTDVQVTIRKGNDDLIKPRTYSTGFAAQDLAAEVRMFIVADAIWNNEFFVRKGAPITITITGNFAQTATNVIEMGLVPFFPTTTGVGSKFFSQSGIVMHLQKPGDAL